MTQYREESLQEAIQELQNQENLLASADDELARAVGRHQIAAKRYAAVRDAIEEMLGHSPYTPDTVTSLWPGAVDYGPDDTPPWDAPNFGRYRYLYKGVGDAVAEELQSWNRPLGIAELVSNLRAGGLHVDGRAVNASLLNMGGAQKQEDGTYIYQKAEDLPL